MAKRKKKNFGGSADEPPMSSMIDVVFLLLIYFVVTQKPIISEAHLAVNLPTPNSQQPPSDEEPPIEIRIRIRPDSYSLQGRKIDMDSLRSELASYGAKKDAKYSIMIETHIFSHNQQLVNVLDACSASSLTNLNILTLD
jgi:biopolymer transport protein ExbD